MVDRRAGKRSYVGDKGRGKQPRARTKKKIGKRHEVIKVKK